MQLPRRRRRCRIFFGAQFSEHVEHGPQRASANVQSLAGRAVLVTGAARRIGAALARGFHAHGANVCIHCHRSIGEAEQLRDELNGRRARSAIDRQRRPARCRLVARHRDCRGERVRASGRADQQRLVVLSDAARQRHRRRNGTTSWARICGHRSSWRRPLRPQLRATKGAILNMVDIHASAPACRSIRSTRPPRPDWRC